MKATVEPQPDELLLAALLRRTIDCDECNTITVDQGGKDHLRAAKTGCGHSQSWQRVQVVEEKWIYNK